MAEHKSQVERKGQRPVQGRSERDSDTMHPVACPEVGSAESWPTVNAEQRYRCRGN